MRRRLESLLPVVVFVGFLVAAVVVNLLLTSAKTRGVDALQESVTGEVQAVARSQNQRIANSFGGTAGISSRGKADPYEIVPNSPGDLDKLNEIVNLLPPTFRSGFYLVDLQGRITQGVRFVGDPIGQRFTWPGYEELIASPAFAAGGGILPISKGYTTAEPVTAFAIPVFDVQAVPPKLLGSFIFESVVAVDSDFNKEIGQLKRGETGRYYVLDSAGSAIASNDSSAIAHVLPDKEILASKPGLHHLGSELVVVADVPAAHWRVVFRQDRGEFERSLAGPLDSVGRILIFSLLTAGLLLTLLLARRLRAARAEQERLRQLSEAQQEFISIVSHELRTPVAGVLGFLETSLDHWDAMSESERKTAVTRAASNARRLQAMTRDVLDTQSFEAGRVVHVLERLDLAEEVRTAVRGIGELDPDRQIEVVAPTDPVVVDGDADRLQQVLVNLIDNARKNSPATEPITITVTPSGAVVQVAVMDHGPGITADGLERIFDKFTRGRGDTVSGTGLGLYISRRIISAHNGRIWAESEPGQGAIFRFELPQAVVGDPTEASESEVVT